MGCFIKVESLSYNDILALPQRDRTDLINGLPSFKGVVLVGTANQVTDNLAIFNSVFHIGASPPLLGLIFRPDSVERHTLENIRLNHFYTINIVTKKILNQSHQTSARYPRNISEFDAVQLNRFALEGFNVPAVAESPLKIWMKLEEELFVTSNNTHIVIGSVQHLVYEEYMRNNNQWNYDKFNAITSMGLNTYFLSKKLATLSYAKPEISSI